MKNKIFDNVYPFTTEEIASYFPILELKGKSVLTVGSSSDQAFNALLLGAKNITVYDINENATRFGKLKKDIIINTQSRKQMYDKVLRIKEVPLSQDVFSFNSLKYMNTYMASQKSYSKLRKLLSEESDKISYVEGNIMDLQPIKDKRYDVIITSNVLQYLDFFVPQDASIEETLQSLFNELKDHLTEKGILQLLYYYSFTKNHMKKDANSYTTEYLPWIVDTLSGNMLYLDTFENSMGKKDAIVTYVKK